MESACAATGACATKAFTDGGAPDVGTGLPRAAPSALPQLDLGGVSPSLASEPPEVEGATHDLVARRESGTNPVHKLEKPIVWYLEYVSDRCVCSFKKVLLRFLPDNLITSATARHVVADRDRGRVTAAAVDAADACPAAGHSPAWQFKVSRADGSWDAATTATLAIPLALFPELLRPTSRTATPDSVTLKLLRRHWFPLGDHFRCTGGTEC